ncbi:hypothetical protein Nepgr_013551 [Nepenthes gracilis]|uniref:Uncharacterized protein n=1 Tax=Nepenthes gracilis TaxID=150966 RepID=A0AAD3SJ24_NEPGR|nr:hypothetical protein Nepgr_013551 [Nepenthes gracilis]
MHLIWLMASVCLSTLAGAIVLLKEWYCCSKLGLGCSGHLLKSGAELALLCGIEKVLVFLMPGFLSFADYGMAAGLLWCIASFAGCLQMVSSADLVKALKPDRDAQTGGRRPPLDLSRSHSHHSRKVTPSEKESQIPPFDDSGLVSIDRDEIPQHLDPMPGNCALSKSILEEDRLGALDISYGSANCPSLSHADQHPLGPASLKAPLVVDGLSHVPLPGWQACIYNERLYEELSFVADWCDVLLSSWRQFGVAPLAKCCFILLQKMALLLVAEALVVVLKLVWLLSRFWCFHCNRHDGWLLCVVSPTVSVSASGHVEATCCSRFIAVAVLPAKSCCVQELSLMNISVLLAGLNFGPAHADGC